MKKYHVVDKDSKPHTIRPKNVIDFSSRPEWWSCTIYKLWLASIDKNIVMNLCVKKAKQHLLDNLSKRNEIYANKMLSILQKIFWNEYALQHIWSNLDNQSVEHQMNVFRALTTIPWATYTDAWINIEKQILIAPFLWDEKTILYFSANNKSLAKERIINEYNTLHWRDISNLPQFIEKANMLMDRLAKQWIVVFDDAFLFGYNADWWRLDIIIWDFHDIILPSWDSEMLTVAQQWAIKSHNRAALEYAYQQLADDKVIKEDIVVNLQHELYGLNDY